MRFFGKLLILLAFIDILLIGTGLILTFKLLVPSIKARDLYLATDCKVLDSYISTHCNSTEACISYNDKIWWYKKFGTAEFFQIFNLPSDEEYQPDDVDVDTDTGSSALKENIIYLSSSDKEQLEFTRSIQNVDANSGDGQCSLVNTYNCQLGNHIVQYTDLHGNLLNNTISGLWANDLSWVDNYISTYLIGRTYTCHVDSPEEPIWFRPSINGGSVVGVALVFSFALIGIIAILILLLVKYKRKIFRCGHRKQRYHGRTSHL